MNQVKRYNLLLISFLICNFTTLIANPITSFTLTSLNLDKDSNFDSNFDLLGDAQIDHKGNFVNLTSPSSTGQIVYRKPFNLFDSKSFSTEFSFSITPGDGDGIAFVIMEDYDVLAKGYFGLLGNDKCKFVAVEYDTRKGHNHVVVNVGNKESDLDSAVIDASSIGIVLNNGAPLKSWVDYDASSKRLEIRLAKIDDERPYNPLISYFIDLSKMWGNKDVFIGISSLSKGLNQSSSLSSWSFEVRTVDKSLHSEPLNPDMKFDELRVVSKLLNSDPMNPEMKFDEVEVRVVYKKSWFLNFLGAVIFATVCGTLVAFLGLFAWVILFGRHSNVVPELPMNTVDFKYEKVDVVVDDVFMRSTTS